MDKKDFETLSAFIDGEKIGTERLAKLLNTRGAQEMLKDFLLLRLKIQNDQSQPTPAFYEKLKHRIETSTLKTRWWRYAIPIPMPVLVTIFIAIVSLTIWVGLSIRWNRPSVKDKPPTPDRVVHFQEGEEWKRF
jgi:hypothetical protein